MNEEPKIIQLIMCHDKLLGLTNEGEVYCLYKEQWVLMINSLAFQSKNQCYNQSK